MLSVHHDHNNNNNHNNDDDNNNHDNHHNKEARGPTEVPELDDAGVVDGGDDVDASHLVNGDHYYDVTIVLNNISGLKNHYLQQNSHP